MCSITVLTSCLSSLLPSLFVHSPSLFLSISLRGGVEESPHEDGHQLLHSQPIPGGRACDHHLPSSHPRCGHHWDLVLWTVPLQGHSLFTGNSFLGLLRSYFKCFQLQSWRSGKIVNELRNKCRYSESKILKKLILENCWINKFMLSQNKGNDAVNYFTVLIIK